MAATALADESLSRMEVLDPDEAWGVGAGSDILIVDDDPGTLAAYEAALEPLGRKLVIAASGMEAIAKLLERDFALLLLDVAMPGLDGIATARLVRERPRNRGLPIVFITGQSWSTELIVEAYDVGGCDFVMKPIMPEVLRAKARVHLQLQDRTRALVHYARQLHDTQLRADHSAALEQQRAMLALAVRRLETLQRATTALARAKTAEEVAGAAVRFGAEALDADAAGLWVAANDGSLVLAGLHGPRERIEPTLPVMRVYETRAARWSEQAAVLPLFADRHGYGVIAFAYERVHRFADEERELVETIAQACRQALERIEARNAADAASRRTDELVAMLGHELRNPLAAVTSALDLITMREGTPSRELSIVARHVVHLSRIVNDLVDVARVTRGKIRLEREALELREAVADAIALAGPVLEHHAHDLVVDVPESLRVDADRERIAQVLANLLTNAAQYTPGRGRIEVSAKSVGDRAQIKVRDNGRGIPKPLLATLFDAFVQSERTADRYPGGLGIGLTLVRQLVELHGGTVEAHSDGVGTGATITIEWPLTS